jgi:hypothetical protein
VAAAQGVTEIPPSRWKVVERGRRLVVIDTLSGEEAGPSPAVAPPSTMISADKGSVLTTRAWYDVKGPRTIALDARAVALLGRARTAVVIGLAIWVVIGVTMPLLFAPLLALGQVQVRGRLRDAATRFIDRLEPRPRY